MAPRKISEDEILVIGTAVDITEKKSIENQLIKQNEELRKANMELDRFVYSTSHDLRAPLTSVLGLIDLFSKETSDPSHMLYLDMITKSIRRLDKFISNIVDYSRNSRTSIAAESINFQEIISESLEQLKYLDNHNQIVTNIKIDDHVSLNTDKTRLQMVINNLISNAIKYKKKNSECIIEIGVSSVPNGQIKITISDNGIGIPKESLSKVFEMFYTGNTENHGSGIGLYIVKESIAKLNGTIEVNSEIMKGTSFSIFLPANLNQ
ncbi:MAG: HAMP domain-containing histidine kinase [Bacteroidetes bacterium]|nr:HAMP domain-containing histidine kinase [Bacteroidota bacterium]